MLIAADEEMMAMEWQRKDRRQCLPSPPILFKWSFIFAKMLDGDWGREGRM
jgi:hypothetical protein